MQPKLKQMVAIAVSVSHLMSAQALAQGGTYAPAGNPAVQNTVSQNMGSTPQAGPLGPRYSPSGNPSVGASAGAQAPVAQVPSVPVQVAPVQAVPSPALASAATTMAPGAPVSDQALMNIASQPAQLNQAFYAKPAYDPNAPVDPRAYASVAPAGGPVEMAAVQPSFAPQPQAPVVQVPAPQPQNHVVNVDVTTPQAPAQAPAQVQMVDPRAYASVAPAGGPVAAPVEMAAMQPQVQPVQAQPVQAQMAQPQPQNHVVNVDVAAAQQPAAPAPVQAANVGQPGGNAGMQAMPPGETNPSALSSVAPAGGQGVAPLTGVQPAPAPASGGGLPAAMPVNDASTQNTSGADAGTFVNTYITPAVLVVGSVVAAGLFLWGFRNWFRE